MENLRKKPAVLLIMDGYGISPPSDGNAIYKACTPGLDRLFATCPHSLLQASGTAVGLPEGQMGNSEVGHLNIGAGRIVWQDLTAISNSIEDGSFFENEALLSAIKRAVERGKTLHLMGLLSDGGVHSHITHLEALLKMAKMHGAPDVFVHSFLDGRDVPPTSAEGYISELEETMRNIGVGKLASISGRYYAMDRDRRWERLEIAYDVLTGVEGRTAPSATEVMALARRLKETDEFVIPTSICAQGEDMPAVSDGDSIVFFNFRPDRAREITRALVDADFEGFSRKKTLKDLHFVCFTEYDSTMPNVSIAFPPRELKDTLGEYLSSLGLRQLRIAETEKYAHVTFFFNGGVEAPNEGEDRILIPSPKVPTYDLKPEMSAPEITERVLEELDRDVYDVVIINFANCDMVGHTGVFDAAVKAVETVDACVGRITDKVAESGGFVLVTSDHGNADQMLNGRGEVVTAHSKAPVPLILVGESGRGLRDGSLCDIAPTLLQLMNLAIPESMTGKSLLLPRSSE